jgi:TctA family transporter
MLFIERKDFVWGLIASMYLGNVVALVLVLATVPIFAAILRIPFTIIGPVIVVVVFHRRLYSRVLDVRLWLVLAFRLAGYAFKKLDYPIAPMVLAMVLGDKAEDAFRQSMIMSKGTLSIFWSNPLVGTLMTSARSAVLAGSDQAFSDSAGTEALMISWPIDGVCVLRRNELR